MRTTELQPEPAVGSLRPFRLELPISNQTTSHLVSGCAVWASDTFFLGRATVTKQVLPVLTVLGNPAPERRALVAALGQVRPYMRVRSGARIAPGARYGS